MKYIIIDDDEASRDVLLQLAKQVGQLQVINAYSSPVEAMSVLENGDVDLVFLDIEMPEMNGMDMLKNMNMPPTILTTTHKEFALDAFEHNVIDYLVKPISLPRFIKAMKKAEKSLLNTSTAGSDMSREYLFIKKHSMLSKVAFKDILWVEALGDYIKLHTTDAKHIVHLSLRSIEGKLPKTKFLRVHRSYIVNIDDIDSVEENTIYIQNNPIPVGALYRKDFKNVVNML